MPSNAKTILLLIKSEDYREFLKDSFVQMKAAKKSTSLSTLAKKIGCRSKSYPREVMTGRRALTNDYAPRFADAFGIRGDAKKLFLKYVELERAPEKERLNFEIHKLRARLLGRIEHDTVKPSDLFLSTVWVDVFAALGSPDSGASLEEICSRTELKKEQVSQVLNAMIPKGLVRRATDSDRYLPIMLHHFFNGAEADTIFQDRFLELLDRTKVKAKVSMKSETELFLCSTISVKSFELPRLKSELREVINKFLQDNECAEGDRISSVLIAML